MKKINVPENYFIYNDDNECLYGLDEKNHNLIDQEHYRNQSYTDIPEDKKVECFIMDYDKATDTSSINFKKKVTKKMNLLSPTLYRTKPVNIFDLFRTN